MTAIPSALHRFGDVTVRLSVELGRADMPLKQVLSLGEGSVVTLDRLTDELLDVTANGRVIARGEVIAQDGRFALRIVNLAGEDASSAPQSSGAQNTVQRPDAEPPVLQP
ncbi:flagellar motor switch protein FliN [Erythrobacter insulae]|uniref:Flagellar motor switch protein FliN n=1 Tax=Erythrobacter insulae TaxID=2584124 RepID=A0A547PAC2_9SPHN|nr:flagellar motor switch protein FliN [Erythrobacter insulae]TRD11057.1 flagellar motor switch protein FliN [Erythrobacter insulae]